MIRIVQLEDSKIEDALQQAIKAKEPTLGDLYALGDLDMVLSYPSATGPSRSTLNSGLPELPPKPIRKKGIRNAMVVVAFCILATAASLESVIVSTALPSLKRDLASSASDYAWVGSAYLLASTCMLPVWARLSDILGRKWTIIAADAYFLA